MCNGAVSATFANPFYQAAHGYTIYMSYNYQSWHWLRLLDYPCRSQTRVLTDLVLKSNIRKTMMADLSFTSLKDIKVKQNDPFQGLKKDHQTLSKKKSKHVKSIQVIHVYITVHLGFWSHPSLPIFCNSAWHSWWRHARWHAWHSWRYHTPEAISDGANQFGLWSRATGHMMSHGLTKKFSRPQKSPHHLLASDNFICLTTKLSPPNGMPGGRAGKPGGIPGLTKSKNGWDQMAKIIWRSVL